MVTNQAYTFMIFVIVGIFIGILFDFFRILRKSFSTKDFVTYIEDILFCVLTGIILLYSIFAFNSGEIRIYIFIGLLFGGMIYMLSISKYFVKISVFLINKTKNIVKQILKIIKIPIAFCKGLLQKIFKPISFVIINVRKNLSKFPMKLNYLGKNKKINKKMS